MKKTSLIIALAVTFAACQQEEITNNQENISAENFIAQTEEYSSQTKTSLNDTHMILWSANDEISIFNGNFDNAQYQVNSECAGKPNASFSFLSKTEATVQGEIDRNVAIYPYMESHQIYNVFNEEQTEVVGISVTGIEFPYTQYYTDGTFAEESFPMMATTMSIEDKMLKFKNLAGVLKLQVLGNFEVSKIRIMGLQYEILNGTFEAVSYYNQSNPELRIVEGNDRGVELQCPEGLHLNMETPQIFYISMPPTVFEKGFSVYVTNTEGASYRMRTTKTHEIQRSTILTMPPFVVGQSIDISESEFAIPDDGTPVEVDLTASYNWEVANIPEWVEVTPSSGEAGTTTLKISKKEGCDPSTYSNHLIYFVCGDASDRLVVYRDIPITTCADVNNGIDGNEYRVRGYVEDIANTTYGNIYITDETGTLFIYGTEYNGYLQNFSQLGINIGDIITLQGPRTTYGTTVELVNAAILDIEKSNLRIIAHHFEDYMIPQEGAEFSVIVRCYDDNLNVIIPEDAQSWLTLESIEAIDDNGYVATFIASANDIGDRQVTLKFTSSTGTKKSYDKITYKQVGGIVESTIQAFLNQPVNSTTYYKLTGVIESIKNSTYGNFDLRDETGSVYVYGLTATKVSKNDKSFESLGLQEGDTVTIIGTRDQYRGVDQVSGPAYYVSHISAN